MLLHRPWGNMVAMGVASVPAYLHLCHPANPSWCADVCGDLASGPALGEHLLRMGEALGMAVVPLTPGGSLAIVPGGGEPPEQGQTGRDAMQSEEGELEEGEELQPNGARLSAPASTESSEATRQPTTSE